MVTTETTRHESGLVEKLKLIPATWDSLQKGDTIYLRAEKGAPTYGPYLVTGTQSISKIDGTEPRFYPRNKGMFTLASPETSPETQITSKLFNSLKDERADLQKDLEALDRERLEILIRISVINSMLDRIENNDL